jgi:hypothetical protein
MRSSRTTRLGEGAVARTLGTMGWLDTWAARRGGWTEGRYRFRTYVRTCLPFWLGSLAPPGPRCCGNHEWHNADANHRAVLPLPSRPALPAGVARLVVRVTL